MLLSVFYYITCGQCLGEINSQLGEKHFAALFFTKFSRDLQPFWRIFSKFNLLRSRDFLKQFQGQCHVTFIQLFKRVSVVF